MELHQLRYAVRVAETLNFTRAAAELHLAQPSLSQQIRKLEQELGFPLFERGPARVQPTPEGTLFLPHARAVLDRLAEAALAAEEIRGVQRGQVTLGISPIAGAHLLPPLLRLARERLPGIELSTREGGLEELLVLLEQGAVDLAMVLLPVNDARFACTPLLDEEIVLVLPSGHPLAGDRSVELALLRDEPFVLLTHDYGLRRRVEEECAAAGFAPRVVLQSREVGVVQALVAAGLGVTLLPASAVRRDLATWVGRVLSGGAPPHRRIGLAHRADRYVTIAARALFALAEELGDGAHVV
jgi:LysR family transcriptional regulator, hydrogen peroxide-inducible genes activator